MSDTGIWAGFLRGAVAGAAGTTALNGVTYLDMAVRGRGTSSAPQDLVEAVADRADVTIPGRGDERDNRVAGLGPLSGIAVGVAVGAVTGAVHNVLRKWRKHIPAPIAILAISGAAMAMSDVPLQVFGLSDPKEWTAKDWVSDIVPHLVYGATTYATLHAGDAA